MGTVVIEARRGNTDGVLPTERMPAAARRNAARPRKIGAAMWIVQGLLALLFLFAGGMKLVVPLDVLAAMTPLPVVFMRFIGLVEVLGGLGLVLPGLTRIRPGLTPLAGAGLALEMVGATVTTLVVGGGATALMPLAVGFLAAFVAYGRWRVARQPSRSGRPALASAYPIHPHSR
jgi:hypothetical protein